MSNAREDLHPPARHGRTVPVRAIVLACALLIGRDAALGAATREYKLSGNRVLLLSVPDAWKETLEKGGDAPTLTITYSDPKTAGWVFLVSVLSKPENPAARFDAEFVREVVVANGKKLLEGSVETDLDVKDLAGAGVTGYYYHLTDRKPQLQPDDYRYMTQGMAGLGSIALTFTLLSNSRDTHVLEQALDAVKGATAREK